MGSWRIHVSYLEGGYLSGSDQTIFSQGNSSLFYFSVNTVDPKPLTLMDGLYDQSFSASAFDPASKKLIVGYQDGTVDLVGEKNVQRLTSIRDNPLILNKNINSAKSIGGFIYLTGDFGIGVIDPQRAAFVSSFINIGPNGSTLEVFDIDEDSRMYYLATSLGLVTGDKNQNLNDFRNWQIQNLDLDSGVRELEVYDGSIYLIGLDKRAYVFEGGALNWMIGTENVSSLKKFGGQLFFSDRNSIYQVGEAGSFLLYFDHTPNEIFDFHIIAEDIYISQAGSGILNISSNTFTSPNGPSSSVNGFYWDKNGTWALPVGFQLNGTPFRSVGGKTSVLKKGVWSESNAPEHVISKTIFKNSNYFGTLGGGLWQELNSDLQQIELPGTNQNPNISSLVVENDNTLWVGIFDNFGSLLKISGNGDISQVQVQGLQFPRKIIVDRSGNLWIFQKPPSGQSRIRVFNERTGLNRLLSSAVNQGNLPNTEIRDMDLDLEGNLWVGTSSGVFYLPFVQFVNPNSPINSIFPIFENRQLLSGVSITAVLVAPDQTKWFGAERDGLWQFSEFGDEMFGHFTGDNSPLTLALIQSLAFDLISGELLIAQPNAAFSYRTNSMISFENFSELKIFPNPVRPDFSGYLSLEGLTDFSQIKITTSSGRVVYSTQVRGGKATWNIMEGLGGRPGPGVYLVYVIDASGQERISGKFVVL
ncbi:T9SS type A sorting domain-containing protein [Aquiflexum sp.]|uniref:type IX secretion system anionic LPS delivery protein PorZ n=1 Tax=Aquiflexum sp. TaxID=1872584 RepID=UPI0035937744